MAGTVALPIEDGRLKAIFSYPHFSDAHYQAVLGELKALQVEGIVLAGGLEVGEVRIIGKGCTAIVCLGVIGGREVAVKIRRSDSSRESLEGEGANLEYANSFGVGPKIFGSTRNVIAMEHIQGKVLPRWLEEAPRREAVRRAVLDILMQCHSLDAHGLDHGELSDAKKHIIIDKSGGARIIDFESASRSRRCRNLNSVVGYLLFKDSISRMLGAHIEWDRKRLSEIMKGYKAAPSERGLEALIYHLKLY
ncbi:MAG: hypothetical protein WHS82_07610 [Candidatus Methanosuratincola sp.]